MTEETRLLRLEKVADNLTEITSKLREDMARLGAQLQATVDNRDALDGQLAQQFNSRKAYFDQRHEACEGRMDERLNLLEARLDERHEACSAAMSRRLDDIEEATEANKEHRLRLSGMTAFLVGILPFLSLIITILVLAHVIK